MELVAGPQLLLERIGGRMSVWLASIGRGAGNDPDKRVQDKPAATAGRANPVSNDRIQPAGDPRRRLHLRRFSRLAPFLAFLGYIWTDERCSDLANTASRKEEQFLEPLLTYSCVIQLIQVI